MTRDTTAAPVADVIPFAVLMKAARAFHGTALVAPDRECILIIARAIMQDRADLSARAEAVPAGDEAIPFDKKEQGLRCGCRGSDDWCPCQNVPDRQTIAAHRARILDESTR